VPHGLPNVSVSTNSPRRVAGRGLSSVLVELVQARALVFGPHS